MDIGLLQKWKNPVFVGPLLLGRHEHLAASQFMANKQKLVRYQLLLCYGVRHQLYRDESQWQHLGISLTDQNDNSLFTRDAISECSCNQVKKFRNIL